MKLPAPGLGVSTKLLLQMSFVCCLLMHVSDVWHVSRSSQSRVNCDCHQHSHQTRSEHSPWWSLLAPIPWVRSPGPNPNCLNPRVVHDHLGAMQQWRVDLTTLLPHLQHMHVIAVACKVGRC